MNLETSEDSILGTIYVMGKYLVQWPQRQENDVDMSMHNLKKASNQNSVVEKQGNKREGTSR